MFILINLYLFRVLQLNTVLRLETRQRILNFRVMPVRDTELRSRLSKNKYLCNDF